MIAVSPGGTVVRGPRDLASGRCRCRRAAPQRATCPAASHAHRRYGRHAKRQEHAQSQSTHVPNASAPDPGVRDEPRAARSANGAGLVNGAEEGGARDAELRRLRVALQVGDQPSGACGELRVHSRYRFALRGVPPRFRVGERLPGALDFRRHRRREASRVRRRRRAANRRTRLAWPRARPWRSRRAHEVSPARRTRDGARWLDRGPRRELGNLRVRRGRRNLVVERRTVFGAPAGGQRRCAGCRRFSRSPPQESACPRSHDRPFREHASRRLDKSWSSRAIESARV